MKMSNKYNLCVGALFDEIQQLTYQKDTSEAHLLQILRTAASSNKPEWEATTEQYLSALLQDGKVSQSQFDSMHIKFKECINKSPDSVFFFTPIIWSVCLCIMVMLLVAFNLREYLPVKMFLALMISYLGWKMSFELGWVKLKVQSKKQRVSKICFSIFYALVAPAVIVTFGWLLSTATFAFSEWRFVENRQSFLNNQNEFPFIREFVKTNFDIEVTLGTRSDAWAYTSLTLPIPASPAAMDTRAGYCTLYMNKAHLLEAMGTQNLANSESWIKGIMIHEFAHCLDVIRDQPIWSKGEFGINAISPLDASNVRNAETYLAASEKLSSTLWKEAFADVLAIGFWRLAVPAQAQNLALELREHRTIRASDDPGHATSCWIDQALKVDSPENFKALVAWSDKIRKNFYNQCSDVKSIKLNIFNSWFAYFGTTK